MKNFKYILFALVLFLVGSCKYEFPEIAKPQKGGADFTKYIAVGNSLTAGYMNGALYDSGQHNSYPVILAKQMRLVGGGDFKLPDINSVNGFFAVIPGNIALGRLTLKYGCPNGGSPSPAPLAGSFITPYTGGATTLNNFGIPGIKLIYAGNSAASLNPYYSRWFGSPGEAAATSPIALAAGSGATFFSLWLGNNDALAYAVSGGTVSVSGPPDYNAAPVPPPYLQDANGNVYANPASPDGAAYYITPKQANQNGTGANDMTPAPVFSGAYTLALNSLLGATAKGVIATIPDVTNTPYFTTIPAEAFKIPLNLGLTVPAQAGPPLGGKTYAQILNELYFQYGFTTQSEFVDYGGGNFGPKKVFSPDNNNYLVIETFTPDGKRSIRQIDPATDLVGLRIPTDSLGLGPVIRCGNPTASLKAGWGLAKNIPITAQGTIDLAKLNPNNVKPYPIPSAYILDKAEKEAVSARIVEFNAAITVAANNERVALVDIYSVFKNLTLNPPSLNGIQFTASISPPFGAFSLDGIHPNARGYAFVANKFIDAINTKFGSTIPAVNPNNYAGNDLPR